MTLLKIDIDMQPPKEWMDAWLNTRKLIIGHLGYTWLGHDIFTTKRGIHVYIRILEKMRDAEINKLQFLCGDDPTRVKINAWRIERGVKYWNKLFHDVLYRRKPKLLECYYCGNKIPVPDKWFK
jgi:hypothetical protein